MVFGLSAQNVITVTDATLEAGQTYNWSNDNEYLLDGLVYLETGGTLNIEAGTVIRGANDPSSGDNTSALIITRGATINANGTADAPIIFTAEEDDITDPSDFTFADRGEWGGLIILGSAVIARPGGEDGIEGIDADEDRAKYGGTDNEDSSGSLTYVSIRHGGSALSPNNEINGLTLGGVGSGTFIDYVEVFANFDDGIEFFGGTVDIKHASVAFCGDDAIDYDYGYRGRGQFWFALQEPTESTGRCGEHDGAKDDDVPPFSKPVIYNATYIGVGTDATVSSGDAADANKFILLARDNAGGEYWNSIFMEGNGAAIAIEDRDDTNDGDAFARLQAGDLAFVDNFFFGFGDGASAADLFLAVDPSEANVASSSTVAAMLGGANTIANPMLAGVSRIENNGLDPRLNAGSPALGGGTPASDPFFNQVTYRGAFGNSVNWLAGWTALAEYGFLGDAVTPINTFDCITVTDADLVAGGDYTWASGSCYTLDGLVFLEEGGALTIEPGVVVRGLGANDVSTGDNTSALIIARGATIEANGTADMPIIFTAAEDDLTDPEDFTAADRGEWGGLIVLGAATIARPGGEDGIEGIDADEQRAKYGGNDDTDDSGSLRYISIRHGGAALSPNNEINGLTLGGVGSGTEIDFVEVIANFDDGIEFFGGTVDMKHAAVAFCGDDAFDYDYGYRGNGQFWFSFQDAEFGDTGRAGEHDGAKEDDVPPFSNPTIYNATYVGIGENASVSSGDAADALAFAVLHRDNSGGSYNNSIFTDFNGAAIAIEDRDDTNNGDAFARLEAGDLSYNNNIFFGFGEGDTPADIFLAVDPAEAEVPASSAVVQTNFMAAGNQIINPVLQEMDDRTMVDPRPSAFGPAASGAPAPVGDFFDAVEYYGAFAPGNGTDNPYWIEGWTAITEYMTTALTTGVGTVETAGFLLDAPVPNPAYRSTQISFELPATTEVTMVVVDIMGRSVKRILHQQALSSGEQMINIDVSDLANGQYIIVLQAGGTQLLQKMIVNR
ncbi:MAG: T9SS type A sorting domain-containing protein [Bacteroidota bacterium]